MSRVVYPEELHTKNRFRYENIFMYGSLQSVGHTEEYFVRHTEKLLVYIVMPRVQNRNNLLRIYTRGTLTKELSVWSSGNLFLYYASWLFHYWKFILTYFGRSEHLLVFSGHPISFFCMAIQKLLRPRVAYAYWIGDYFPPVHWSLRLFERIKKHYHDRVSYVYYLSDTINRIMNGRVVNERNRHTVMWGVQPLGKTRTSPRGQFRLLFVGVVRLSQGLEDIFLFLAKNKDVHLRIVGVCESRLFETYQNLIGDLRIESRVDFLNAFVDEEELKTLAKEYHVGIALYEKGITTATYYTDPGKIKTYVDLGLPVIMTNISAIAYYIQKFKAGEVIDEVSELPVALAKIKEYYPKYQKGLRDFSKHFEYEKYYRQAFTAFEKAG